MTVFQIRALQDIAAVFPEFQFERTDGRVIPDSECTSHVHRYPSDPAAIEWYIHLGCFVGVVAGAFLVARRYMFT